MNNIYKYIIDFNTSSIILYFRDDMKQWIRDQSMTLSNIVQREGNYCAYVYYHLDNYTDIIGKIYYTDNEQRFLVYFDKINKSYTLIQLFTKIVNKIDDDNFRQLEKIKQMLQSVEL